MHTPVSLLATPKFVSVTIFIVQCFTLQTQFEIECVDPGCCLHVDTVRDFQFKIQFLHPFPLWNPIYFVRSFSLRVRHVETNLLHVDFMQHNGTFYQSKISYIEQKKG